MADNTEPAESADGKPPEGLGPNQRRVFGTKRHATPAPTSAATPPELEEKIANLVDSVKVLQSHLAGGRPLAETAPEIEPKPRRPKRFQRVSGTEETADAEVAEPVLDHDVRGDETTLNKNIAWPRLTRPEEAPVSFGGRAASYMRRHPFILWVLAQAAGLGLLMLGFWAGQSVGGDDEDHANAKESPAQAAQTDALTRSGVNDRAFQAIANALRAEKAGDLNTARQTYEEAVAGRLRVPGAEYRLALIEIERNDLTSADIHLTKSLVAGEMMAACYLIQARFAGNDRNYVEAAKQLARAVKAEPFSAKYLFCWGEALRRAGNTQAGIDALTQALDRPASPADRWLFEFKLRLAKAEAGHDEAFNTELTDHLAHPPVNGDWLLLAAGQELSHAAYADAGRHLGEASRVLSLQEFSLLVQDYAFQSYANHPEIGPLLKVEAPPSSDKPLDPGAWPAQEADPAIWPPFTPAL